MAEAKQYFDLITDCLRWADEAENSDAREAFLALAETWKKVAELELKTSGRSLKPFESPFESKVPVKVVSA
jgi:hypothetical protein